MLRVDAARRSDGHRVTNGMHNESAARPPVLRAVSRIASLRAHIDALMCCAERIEFAEHVVSWLWQQVGRHFQRVELWGSLSRGTGVRGHSDIDILVCLNGGDARRLVTAEERMQFCTNVFCRALQLAPSDVREQNHSLSVPLVIPRRICNQPNRAYAFRRERVDLVLVSRQERGAGLLIPTRPTRVERVAGIVRGTQATRRPTCQHTVLAKRLMVFFKAWNYYEARRVPTDSLFSKPLSSLHLELMMRVVV